MNQFNYHAHGWQASEKKTANSNQIQQQRQLCCVMRENTRFISAYQIANDRYFAADRKI